MTWSEEVRPFLERSLQLVDKPSTDWHAVVLLLRRALDVVPAPALPLGVPLAIGISVEAASAEQCRSAIADCLAHIDKQRFPEAVERLQDAWQHAEKDEGL